MHGAGLLGRLVPRGWGVPPRNQDELYSFVSGPAACRMEKESRIFATSMAHRCPKTLLYQSGERPLQVEAGKHEPRLFPRSLSRRRKKGLAPSSPGINGRGHRCQRKGAGT